MKSNRSFMIRAMLFLLLAMASMYSHGANMPIITSFSPSSGPVGSTVILTGNHFDPVFSNNIVYFGATRAAVVAGTSSTLTVIVPFGATYQYITVTVIPTQLTGYSLAPFITTFPCGGTITANSFAAALDFNSRGFFFMTLGDLDGDQKPDVITNDAADGVSIFRNTSSVGAISLTSKIDFPFPTGYFPFPKADLGDLDGDGKLDLVIASSSDAIVMRNTSTLGTISFAPPILIPVGIGGGLPSITIADIDGDGKPDLITSKTEISQNVSANTISVSLNTTVGTTISFAPSVAIPVGNHPRKVVSGDLNGDGKPDLGVANANENTISILINTSSIGTVSFAPKVDLTTGNNAINLTFGDFDNDHQLDIAAVSLNSPTVAVFKNTSTTSVFSVGPKLDFFGGPVNLDMGLADIDGDGKIDMLLSGFQTQLAVLKNTTLGGTISFAPKVDLPIITTTSGKTFVIGDIDGDGLPDISLTIENQSQYTVSILKNQLVNLIQPTVSVTTSTQNICPNQPATFTASVTNGGATPTYQWQVNGIPVGTNSATYVTSSLTHGDIVNVKMLSNALCTLPVPVTSNSISMQVNAITPSLNISTNVLAFCEGTSIIFKATAINGGTAPTYQWKINGLDVGSNSDVFSTTTLKNDDQVTCLLTSNAPCASPALVISNPLQVKVNPILSASVTITAPVTTICPNTQVTFKATAINGGTAPTYQWKINGLDVGSNSDVFSTTTLKNDDQVTCLLTSTAPCASPALVISNPLQVKVNPILSASVTITTPVTTICPNTQVTFNATIVNGGTAPNYQWKINGINVGPNSSTYATSNLKNSDIVTCVLTGSSTCSTYTVSSNPIQINVTESQSPKLTINSSYAEVCANTLVTFTAVPQNEGVMTTFEWQVNGKATGSTSLTYSSSTLLNGDNITCIMRSKNACDLWSTTLSNSIAMTVRPEIRILLSPTTPVIDQGKSIQLNADVNVPVKRYLWTPATGLNNPTLKNPIATPLTTTLYRLSVVTDNDCEANASITISVIKNVVIPNVFSPNGDGINDVWRIKNLEDYPNSTLAIYTRNGQLVFKGVGPKKSWDGHFNGKPLPVGVYYYVIDLKKDRRVLTGEITILK